MVRNKFKSNTKLKRSIVISSVITMGLFLCSNTYAQSLNYNLQKSDLFSNYSISSREEASSNKIYNASLFSLENLSKEKFNMSAVMIETKEVKLNDGLMKNSLSNINQNQINYSLLAIEDMQPDNGSGIYVKQNKYSYSSIDDYRLNAGSGYGLSEFGNTSYQHIQANQKYNNTISGKFAINAENSLMASVNEGQNGLEQINYFGGLINSGETKTLGLSLAYNKKINEHNIFAFVGKNWIENNFNNANVVQGEQIVVGVGLNYKTNIDAITLIPQFNVQNIKSALRVNNIDNNYNQTIATIGVKTKYQMDKKLALGASVNVEKDLSVDGNLLSINPNSLSQYKNNSERLDLSLSMAYTPVEQMSLILGLKHGIGNAFKDNAVNVGVRYSF